MAYSEEHPAHRVGVILRHTCHQMDLVGRLEGHLPPSRLQAYVGESTGRYRSLDLGRPGVTSSTVRTPRASTLTRCSSLIPTWMLVTTRQGPGCACCTTAWSPECTHLLLGYAGEAEPPLLAGVPATDLVRKQVKATITS
jgi:hypothetical protein